MHFHAMIDRKQMQVVCLGFFIGTFFSGCAWKQGADIRFPVRSEYSHAQSPPIRSVSAPTSNPAISETGQTKAMIGSSLAKAEIPTPPSPSWQMELARPDSPENNLTAGTVLHVNEDTFEQQVLQSNVPVLVDFYATWCGPCKKLATTLEQVAAENTQVMVVKVDVDDNPKLAARYGVKSLPTLMIFQDGQMVAKQQGLSLRNGLKRY
jgi:thioredoxin 1